MKSQKGITLMSIIVTIIVILILVDVAYSTSTGKDGIIFKANFSTQEHRAGEAKEDMTLAWGVLNTDAMTNTLSSKDNFFTIDNLNNILKTKGVVLSLNFKANDTSNLKYATFVDNVIYDMEVDVQGNVTIVNKTLPESIENSNFLVDKVQIGDYVDININYENSTESNFYSEYVSNDYGETGPKGWRVLSKNGSGITGSVTLISAGVPLEFFYYNNDYTTSMSMLSDLYKEIEVIDYHSANQKEMDAFLSNGFSSNNLKDVFNSSGFIDIAKGIHGVTIDEILLAYKNLTGVNKDFEELLAQDLTPPLKTSTLINDYENYNTRANDLLGNGYMYWIAGFYKYYNSCAVAMNGSLNAMYSGNFADTSGHFGVRPVLTLKYNLEIDDNNTGDGSSLNLAYTLKNQ